MAGGGAASVVRVCVIRFERRLPDVTRPMHPERLENQPTERRIEEFARDRFHNALEPDETLAGIAETLARWKYVLSGRSTERQLGRPDVWLRTCRTVTAAARGSSVT